MKVKPCVSFQKQFFKKNSSWPPFKMQPIVRKKEKKSAIKFHNEISQVWFFTKRIYNSKNHIIKKLLLFVCTLFTTRLINNLNNPNLSTTEARALVLKVLILDHLCTVTCVVQRSWFKPKQCKT